MLRNLTSNFKIGTALSMALSLVVALVPSDVSFADDGLLAQADELMSSVFDCTRPFERTDIEGGWVESVTKHTFSRHDATIAIEEIEIGQEKGEYTATINNRTIFQFDVSVGIWALRQGDDLLISCRSEANCISKLDVPDTGYCPITKGGAPLCPNLSANIWQPPKSMRSVKLKRICPDQIDNAKAALDVVFENASVDTTVSGVLQGSWAHVEGLDEFSIPIRDRTESVSMILGGIAASSGKVNIYSCKTVSGFRSKWCRVNWGGVVGWVSTKHLKE